MVEGQWEGGGCGIRRHKGDDRRSDDPCDRLYAHPK
jgi:hypothetical protein